MITRRAGFLLLAIAWVAIGQTPGLVSLDVHARDVHGQPVRDLATDEIRVFEDGKPKNVIFLQHWSVSARPSDGQPDAREFSNRAEEQRAIAVVVLNLLDRKVQSMQVSETVQAIQRLEASSDLYLYALQSLSGALVTIHGLPSKLEDRNAPSGPWARSAAGQVKAMLRLRSPAEKESASDPNTPIASAEAAIQTVASQMARLPGRKSLVWIGALPLSVRSSDWGGTEYGREMTGNMARLLRLLDSAGAAVFEVRNSRTDPAISAVSGMADQVLAVERPGLAAATGGREYVDQVGRAIADAVSDAREGYRVFYATADSGHARYRKIKLTSTRRGVELRAPQGYDPKLTTEPLVAREVIDSLTGALRDDSDIGLRASAEPASAATGMLRLRLRIDPADLLFTRGRAALAMQVVDYAKDGRSVTAGEARQVEPARDGLELPVEVTFNESVKSIRVIVCDRATRLAGTLTIPLADVTGPAR